MENKIIVCIQCGEEFEFSIKDQTRYQKMNFDDPKRCQICRKNKTNTKNIQDKRSNQRKKSDPYKDDY